jgi:anti-anti-sigma factor
VAEPALLDRLVPGDHVCWAVDDDHVRMEATAAFVRQGLSQHHRIRYCGDAPDAVLTALVARGIDAAAAIRSGQLTAVTAEESYLAGGVFDPEAALLQWKPLADAARAAGYRALRVLGDMSWATRSIAGRDRLFWYEAQVNRVILDTGAIVVCAFDKRLFEPSELRRLTWQHPAAVSTGFPYDERLSLRIRRTHDPVGVRLTGEADLSNRHALRTVFQHLFADARCAEVTVDVSGLLFADRAAARVMVQAGSGPGKLRLVGCSPALARLLRYSGATHAAGLTLA